MTERLTEMFLHKGKLFACDHGVLQDRRSGGFCGCTLKCSVPERQKKASDQVAWDKHSLERTLSCNAERPTASWEHAQQHLQPLLSTIKELLGHAGLTKGVVIPFVVGDS